MIYFFVTNNNKIEKLKVDTLLCTYIYKTFFEIRERLLQI